MSSRLYDIFGLGLDACVALAFDGGKVRLHDLSSAEYTFPSEYLVIDAHFSTPPYYSAIRQLIDPIVDQAEEHGHPRNLITAFYEVVLNAVQHGNQYDPDKTVRVGYQITPSVVNFAVEDQGDSLSVDFIRYIHHQRRREGNYDSTNFYTFAGKQKPPANLGTGTFFTHQYVDAVHYYRSRNGGLIVHLAKRKAHARH